MTVKLQHSIRVNKVYDMLAMGFTRVEVVRKITEEYGVIPRTVDNYIAAANRLFAKDSHYDRAQELGRAISRLNSIFAKCMTDEDYSGALNAQKEMNKLLGLHEPIKIDIQIVLAVVMRLEALQIDPAEFFKSTLDRLE